MHQVFSNVPLTSISKDLRKPLYDIMKLIEKGYDEYNSKKQIVLLLNGGVEKDVRGNKILTKPETPSRGNMNDVEYKAALESHFSKVSVIDTKMRELANEDSGIKVSPVFTESQFEDFCKTINAPLEVNSLESILVKSDP